jgi:hypothetical protein
MPFARRRRERNWVHWLLLGLGLGMIGAGYWSLAVEPDVAADEATRRAFLGMALVTLGAALALLSRWL